MHKQIIKSHLEMHPVALVRRVSPGFASAQRQHGEGPPLDVLAAEEEHDSMVKLSRELMAERSPMGRIVELPGDASQPDCSFIEDCVVPLPGLGFFVCSLHPSRQGEVGPVAEAAASERWRECGRADPMLGECIEGGDVLTVLSEDKRYHFFVGVGNRSNVKGCNALRRALSKSLGYSIDITEDEPVRFLVHEVSLGGTGWLHLKSAVTHVRGAGFLASGADCMVLSRMRECLGEEDATTLRQQMDDPCVVPKHATNALTLPGGAVLAHPDAVGAIKGRLPENNRSHIHGVASPELARADGALTCGVLVLDTSCKWVK